MEPKMLNWIPVGLTIATQHNHCNDVIVLYSHWFSLLQGETVNRNQPCLPIRQMAINMPYHKLHWEVQRWGKIFTGGCAPCMPSLGTAPESKQERPWAVSSNDAGVALGRMSAGTGLLGLRHPLESLVTHCWRYNNTPDDRDCYKHDERFRLLANFVYHSFDRGVW